MVFFLILINFHVLWRSNESKVKISLIQNCVLWLTGFLSFAPFLRSSVPPTACSPTSCSVDSFVGQAIRAMFYWVSLLTDFHGFFLCKISFNRWRSESRNDVMCLVQKGNHTLTDFQNLIKFFSFLLLYKKAKWVNKLARFAHRENIEPWEGWFFCFQINV